MALLWKSIASALVLLAANHGAVQAQPSEPNQPATAVVQQQLDAYNRHDIEALMATYATDIKVYEYPDKVILDGAAKVRERYAQLFADGVLHARLGNRIAIGQRVIDHEFVTRTFADGVGVKQWVAIYDVQDGKIVRVSLIPGPVEMNAKK